MKNEWQEYKNEQKSTFLLYKWKFLWPKKIVYLLKYVSFSFVKIPFSCRWKKLRRYRNIANNECKNYFLWLLFV